MAVPSIDQVVEKLLLAERTLNEFQNKAREAGIEIDLDIALWDVAIDLLGVPEENVPDSDVGEPWVNGFHFCRDWIYDGFSEFEDVKEYMAWVRGELSDNG